ncbi:uncharacterized protein L3040_005010 [Drepanopeziza brunnea f. sp. 'multigermtubi']|uniref:uncharacterized protein n=1 Tax=Drepanopeziza brunnea f. sp. 'multigermtubi' TaxID=698441 RepID=UPI0023898147|nr:hypothetical protein L3040_005010 [Drepanopeziza brunnea f. sp. 'multigermtubi']
MAAPLSLPKADPTAAWNWTFGINATQYVPSAKDLALAGPRMFMKLGSLLGGPDSANSLFGGVRRLGAGAAGQRVIPGAMGDRGVVEALTTSAAAAAAAASAAAAARHIQPGAGISAGAAAGQTIGVGTQILATANVDDAAGVFSTKFSMEGVRSLGNVFSYATSKWALACVVTAVVLNRTLVYASTRRNLVLGWRARFLVRMLPILLLGIQCREILQSMQCQTSPDFAVLRWGNASRSGELVFTQDGGFLHEMSRSLLLGAGDKESCVAVGMVPSGESVPREPERENLEVRGSLELLWPLFKTFALSQFIETLSCAVAGRQVAGETGMTLFEHSLAFAEAEAAVSSQLGWGPFGMVASKDGRLNSTSKAEGPKIAITRSMILKKVNTTPEVLLIGFLSAMNHLTSHVLAILNLQSRFRLVNTGFWGLAFMAAIVSSAWSFTVDDLPSQSLLRFPTVSIVGFVPHVLVLFGIIACSLIYAAALLLSALALPAVEDTPSSGEVAAPGPTTLRRRVIAAHRNMQANVPLATIRITLYMDFYTALLRTGFAMMTMASEAVYLNESRGVNVKQRTWLEEDRLREIEAAGARWLGPTFRLNDPDTSLADGRTDNVGLVAARDRPMELLQNSSSGYAREMTAKNAPAMGNGRERGPPTANGVGATERSGRWIMAMEFFLGISRLLLGWWASLSLKLMARAGIQSRPRLLLWLARMPKAGLPASAASEQNNTDSLDFWLRGHDGELVRPRDDHVDVEVEFRNDMRRSQDHWDDSRETALDSRLYDWFLGGGWWGVDDNSGNFKPAQIELDEDTTSVVSFSTSASQQEDAWESDHSANDDGRRTPTQQDPTSTRESTPFLDTPLGASDLAQLLHPKTPEQRAEAQALSVHLQSEGVVTRSRFRSLMQRERAKVLTSSRHDRPANFAASSPTGRLTLEEETWILEHLILSRRGARSTSASGQRSWARGASGMGEGGPQCVVCQSSPRSIIVWPCRCLSLCDDCRVTLAMNNFEKCVCCRRDVSSFSRVFVP